MVVAVAQLQEKSLRATAAAAAAATAASSRGGLTGLLERVDGLRWEDDEGFAVGGAERIAEIAGGRIRVAVGLIGGVVAQDVLFLIEVDGRKVGAAVVAVGVVNVRREGNVAPLAAQPPEQLELCAGIMVRAVVQRAVAAAVLHQPQVVHRREPVGLERVDDMLEGVLVERCRAAESAAVAGRETQVGAEGEDAERVDVPLQVHVGRPVVLAGVALADAVREGAAAGGPDEVFRARAVPVVGIAAVPRHAAAHLQVAVVLVAGVQCGRLGLALAVAVASAATATAGEVAVVDVVGVAHEGVADAAEGLHRRQPDAVAVVGAVAHVGVHLQTAAGAALGDELEHEVFLTVVDTRQLRQVALLVVGLHLVDDVRRQVLHHGVVVARHEVAAVHLEALHVLAVDADRPVVVDLSAGQRLHQRLDDRPLGHAEGVGVVDDGVVLDDHLGQVGRDDGLAQLDHVGRHGYLAQIGRPVALFVEIMT